MRIRTTAATAALLLAALTACGGSDNEATAETKPSPAASESVDCTSQTLSQSEYMEKCAGEPSESSGAQLTGLKFGQAYTWPDGLKVTVVEAKRFTDYDKELLESAEPGKTDFRISLKVQNTGKAPVDLDDLSIIVEGATKGGEAAGTIFSKGSEPLEGRLAPGVTVVKNNDNVLETGYGKRIVVTVQRSSDDFSLGFPEFEGEITG
ncbi:hypothetical protein [Streptomyces sp. NPDC057052]|uniref:hypothetical protein n=1 Tax=Streptomyces sp. NPDC057052 TaxID=3346010 RepID=UPI00363CDA6F